MFGDDGLAIRLGHGLLYSIPGSALSLWPSDADVSMTS